MVDRCDHAEMKESLKKKTDLSWVNDKFKKDDQMLFFKHSQLKALHIY